MRVSIQTDLARIKSAKSAIKAAIEGKGVTVPDATMLDGMAALIDRVEAGGSVDVVRAASYMPQTFDEVKGKEVLPVPDFAYVASYTNTSDSITLSIDANAGDTIIAVYAMRHLSVEPEAPEGWELIRHCSPTEGDTYSQSLTVYKYCADKTGIVSLTMIQPDPSQRFYGYLVNLRDSLIGNNELIYNSLSNGTSINPIHFKYEHTLVVTTNSISSQGSPPNRPLGLCFDGALSSFHPKLSFEDGTVGAVTMYSSRLSLMYRPFGSKQNSDNHYLSVRNYLGNVSPDSYPTVHLLLEIIPGACTKWITASDDTLILTEFEGGVDISATEAMSIILGGDN